MTTNKVTADKLKQSGAVDGDVLVYNASLDEWVPGPRDDAVELIESGAVSNQANLDIVLPSEFFIHELIFDRLVPVTDNTILSFRVSDDDGATFRAGAGNYFRVTQVFAAAGNSIADASDDKVLLTGSLGNNTNEFLSGKIRMTNLTAAGGAGQASIRYEGEQLTSGSVSRFFSTMARFANGIDAIRLFLSSGNISSMEYALYGYRK